MLKNNPDFKEVFKHDIYTFYIPAQHTKYHTSRYLEANNQLIFAGAGATKEVVQAHCNKVIELCNSTTPITTLRTDIAAIANALLYRTEKPVDAKCAIRLGALLCFMEYEHEGKDVSEDPDQVKPFWLHKKMDLADNSPELYDFFLSWGIASIPEYRTALDTSSNEDYFQKRKEALQSILPQDLQQLANS